MMRPTSLRKAFTMPVLAALVLLLITSKPVHAGVWVTELNSSKSSDINQPCCIAYASSQGQILASGWTNGNAGSTTHTNSGGTDAFVLILNETDGTVLSSIVFGTSENEKVHNLYYNSKTDQIVVFGTTAGTFSGQSSSGGTDLFISVIERSSLAIATFQYGSSGDDEPVDLLFYQDNMYLGIGNGRFERSKTQPTNALVLFQVTTSKSLDKKEVKVMNNQTNGYYGAYAAAPKDTQARFGIAYELSTVPNGRQAYNVTEYNSLFVAQTTNALTKSLGPNSIPISPTALQYSASTTAWWYVASEPGYSNKYYPPSWPGVTNGTSFLIGKVGPDEPLRIPPVIPYDLWFPSALQLDNRRYQYFGFRSFLGTGLTNPNLILNRVGWQYGPFSFHDAQLGAIETFVAGDNWFLQGALPIESNGNFFIYAGRWDQEQNVYNCMGTEMRRNFSFAVGLSDRVIGFGDVGSQCPEYTIDAVKGSGSFYYAIGSSTGSLTGQDRNNAGLTNTTVIMGVSYNNSGPAATRFSFPRIFETCELPCESIPPPTPSPTPSPSPTPTPTRTPGPSSSPTPVPIGTATPTWTRTPTPTLGPLPDDGSPNIGVISGIVVGSVAGAALVNGVGAFIFVQVAASAAAAAAGAAAAGEAEGYYY